MLKKLVTSEGFFISGILSAHHSPPLLPTKFQFNLINYALGKTYCILPKASKGNFLGAAISCPRQNCTVGKACLLPILQYPPPCLQGSSTVFSLPEFSHPPMILSSTQSLNSKLSSVSPYIILYFFFEGNLI